MQKLKRIAELTVAGLLATGLACAAAVTFLLPDYQAKIVQEWNAELDTVNVDDGIDASEAGTIMSIYSGEFISGCGGPATPVLVDGTWVSQLYIGAAGQLSQQFVRVDARTGAVSSTLGPTFPRLFLLKTSIAWGFAWRRMNWIDELP
jgi:hypothetical protein